MKYTNEKQCCHITCQSSKKLWIAAISKILRDFTGLAALINQQSIFFYISLKRNKQMVAFVALCIPPPCSHFRSKSRSSEKRTDRSFFSDSFISQHPHAGILCQLTAFLAWNFASVLLTFKREPLVEESESWNPLDLAPHHQLREQ